MVTIYDKIIERIEKEKEDGYGGIDLALDSTEFCIHDELKMVKIYLELSHVYKRIEYSIDRIAIEQGYCGHHIHIKF